MQGSDRTLSNEELADHALEQLEAEIKQKAQ
jgi:hypothetical protein